MQSGWQVLALSDKFLEVISISLKLAVAIGVNAHLVDSYGTIDLIIFEGKLSTVVPELA